MDTDKICKNLINDICIPTVFISICEKFVANIDHVKTKSGTIWFAMIFLFCCSGGRRLSPRRPPYGLCVRVQDAPKTECQNGGWNYGHS